MQMEKISLNFYWKSKHRADEREVRARYEMLWTKIGEYPQTVEINMLL